MTNREIRVYRLMRRVVFILHGGKCYLSDQVLADPVTHDGGHVWEVHHIKHQRQHPHMRFDLANVVPLAKSVHDLDQMGGLSGLIHQEMGDEAWFELARRANIITSVDLDKVERELNEIIRRGHG